MKLSISTEYIECPPLSPQELAQYEHQDMENVQDSLDKTNLTSHRYQWKRVAHEAEVEIYRGKVPQRPTSALLFCSTVDLAATLDEVIHYFRSYSSAEDSKEMADRTDRGLLDAANLCTTPHLNVRLQWLLEKTLFHVVGKKRDYSTHLLEPDEGGRRTWARCLKSARRPRCAELANVIRAVHYGSGIICRETDRPGYLKLMCIVHCDLGGSLPSMIKERTIMHFCRSIKGIDRRLREDRLSVSPFMTGGQFTPFSSRQQCRLCKRKFGLFRKKKHCCKCGEVVCAQCGPKWTVQVGGTSLKVRACTACSMPLRPPFNAIDTGTVMSTFTSPSSLFSTEVWGIQDDNDDSDDAEPSFVSFTTEGSNSSRHSASTGGRSTFDHHINLQ
ncbi:hypothetical protein Ae201684P_013257 [Aphanomyces euteiches]|nr:hypothetical protein Ae201684P_013257 [Aphanomyces euteiches]